MAQSLADFNRKLELVAKELDGGTGRERMARVGKQTEGDVNDAVRGTLGDQSRSGWTRAKPAEIAGASRVIEQNLDSAGNRKIVESFLASLDGAKGTR